MPISSVLRSLVFMHKYDLSPSPRLKKFITDEYVKYPSADAFMEALKKEQKRHFKETVIDEPAMITELDKVNIIIA